MTGITEQSRTDTAPGAAERLRALYTEEWAWRVDQFADVTGMALAPEAGRPFYSALPDASTAAQAGRLRYWRRVAATLDEIDPNDLPGPDLVNYHVYREQIDSLIGREVWRDHEMPVNSDSAFWSFVADIARRPMHRRQDRESWIRQMRDLPRYFGEVMDRMREGVKRGFTPPRSTLIGREVSISAIIEARPEDTVYFKPFKAAPPEEREEALAVIRDVVIPAHRELFRFFTEEYRPRCRETIAAADLPDGRDYYRSKIREHTTDDLAPEDIHRFGLDEVARLRSEMAAAAREVGFAGSLADFCEFLRTDPQFYARSEDELLMRAAWIAKKFDGVASRYFGLLPRARFALRPVPREIAPYFTAGRGGPGIYLLNTYQLDARPLYSLPALTLHESAPGHAFQMSLAMEAGDLPAFRRQTYLPAYAEGWALYCEELGLEMGMYETPYETFGMLGYQIWRAARLVVDTGVHWFGWSRDDAIRFMTDNTILSAHEIESEVDRYISWPAQALSYYLGEACIRDCRRKAEQALGDRFDLRAFHDAILATGSVPLKVVREAVDRLIRSTLDRAA